MVKYLLALLLLVSCFVSAKAQNDDWFKGSWYGAKSFSRARIGIKVLVRIEVDSLYNNHFSGRLIYMYPKDTIARLIRTFAGNIDGKSIIFNKSKELYLLDPRSRGFWSNCAQCNESGVFLESHGNLVFKITTTGCGDSCDAETVFSRNLDSYDSVAKADIQKMFNQNKEPVTAALQGSPQKIKDKETGKRILVDSPGSSSVTTASATKSSSNNGTASILNIASPVIPGELNTNSKTDSLTATANINSKQKNGTAVVVTQGQPDSARNNTNVISATNKTVNTNSKTDSSIVIGNVNPKQKNGMAVVAMQGQPDSARNKANMTSATKKTGNTNPKTDSSIVTANINPKQKNSTAVVVTKSQPDSARNNTNVTSATKKPVNTNSKTDSSIVTANINPKQKNNTAVVVTKGQPDSARNNTNVTSATKKPVNTNSKTDSSITTANINSKQKNGTAVVVTQGQPDSARSNANVTSATKKPVNTNSKTDSLTGAANINSKQKNTTAMLAKQNPTDPGKKDKTIIASSINPATTSASNQNSTAAKATVDTTKSKQPLSDSSSTPLPLVAAKTFMLADTANQFVSRTDSVAMAKLHRETNVVNEYKVSDPHIEIELFDNGIIDGDAVSVYYNGRMLFNNVVLSYKPIAFSIDASGANRHHEFVLIAENEGSIPPNTALLRITAGNQQYKLFVSTNLSKNAKIAIDYTGD
jgi:hypothetical protein